MPRSMKLTSLLVALGLVTFASGATQAAVISRTFIISATAFSGSPPIDPLSG